MPWELRLFVPNRPGLTERYKLMLFEERTDVYLVPVHADGSVAPRSTEIGLKFRGGEKADGIEAKVLLQRKKRGAEKWIKASNHVVISDTPSITGVSLAARLLKLKFPRDGAGTTDAVVGALVDAVQHTASLPSVVVKKTVYRRRIPEWGNVQLEEAHIIVSVPSDNPGGNQEREYWTLAVEKGKPAFLYDVMGRVLREARLQAPTPIGYPAFVKQIYETSVASKL